MDYEEFPNWDENIFQYDEEGVFVKRGSVVEIDSDRILIDWSNDERTEATMADLYFNGRKWCYIG